MDTAERMLILCSSPYTVFNSINLFLSKKKCNQDLIADIIIFKKTNSMDMIVKSLRKTKIFDNIVVMRDFQSSRFKAFIFLLIRLFPRLSLKIFSDKRFNINKYDMTVSQNFIFTIILGKLLSTSKLYLIEEGVGTYTWRASLPSARNKYLLMANRYIFHGSLIREYEGQYVYMPELILDDRLTPFRLDKVSEYDIELYKKIFGYKRNSLYVNNNVIILGQGNMNQISTDNGVSKGKNRYDIIKELLEADSYEGGVLYRSHPTEDIRDVPITNVIFDNIRNMWELECYTQILDFHITIGFDTTTLALPKILYDKEPVIIVLYHIFDFDRNEVSLLDGYYEHIKKLYRNQSKVMIINNREELLGALKKARKLVCDE